MRTAGPATSARQPFLVARGLVKRYGAETALDHVDLAVRSAEAVAIVGPSGSGKTTLVRVLAGILIPDHGAVVVDGHRIDHLEEARRHALRRNEFGLVSQDGALVNELTVAENTALPLVLRGSGRDEALAAAQEWLEHVGLPDTCREHPDALSAEQTQLVAIARALVCGPKAVFADEPTSSLDSRAGGEVMRTLLRSAASAHAAVVVSTRNKDIAARSERAIEIQDGKFVGGVMTG